MRVGEFPPARSLWNNETRAPLSSPRGCSISGKGIQSNPSRGDSAEVTVKYSWSMHITRRSTHLCNETRPVLVSTGRCVCVCACVCACCFMRYLFISKCQPSAPSLTFGLMMFCSTRRTLFQLFSHHTVAPPFEEEQPHGGIASMYISTRDVLATFPSRQSFVCWSHGSCETEPSSS